jgi:L-methionine (R)-S-oxide reductase
MGATLHDVLPLDAPADRKRAHYDDVLRRVDALLEGETDWVAAMATVACELHHAFDAYDWTGFYRLVTASSLPRSLRSLGSAGPSPSLLVIGPYQGRHGCLRIDLSRGVCGAAARTRTTQVVPDVEAFPGHIACSGSTRSEIVVPIIGPGGRLLGVLDVDSDAPAAFDEVDRAALERLCAGLGARYEGGA